MNAGSQTSSLWSGLLLVGLGGAMVLMAVSGDSLYYVRDIMTIPLIVSGTIVVLLGLSPLIERSIHSHAPKSLWFLPLAMLLLLVVRPGPLSIDTGFRYDFDEGSRVPSEFVIPTSAIVGQNASPSRVRESAVEVHAGQFRFAVTQFPVEFRTVAVRMVGQIDIDDDGNATLVRFWINCCAADALRFAIDLDDDRGVERGQWVEVTGQWDGETNEPGLAVATLDEIPVPDRPYLTIGDA